MTKYAVINEILDGSGKRKKVLCIEWWILGYKTYKLGY